jgi:hypothetical protein
VKSIRHGDIEVPLPQGWNDGTQIVVVGPAQDGFRANLVVAPSQPFPSADAWAKEFLAGVKQFPGTAIKSHAATKVGMMTGYLVELIAPAGNRKAGQLVFYVASGAQGFTITYTDTPERVSKRTEALELIAQVKLR